MGSTPRLDSVLRGSVGRRTAPPSLNARQEQAVQDTIDPGRYKLVDVLERGRTQEGKLLKREERPSEGASWITDRSLIVIVVEKRCASGSSRSQKGPKKGSFPEFFSRMPRYSVADIVTSSRVARLKSWVKEKETESAKVLRLLVTGFWFWMRISPSEQRRLPSALKIVVSQKEIDFFLVIRKEMGLAICGRAMDYGMQEGLAAGHEHGIAGTPLSAVVAYNPETAEKTYLDAVLSRAEGALKAMPPQIFVIDGGYSLLSLCPLKILVGEASTALVISCVETWTRLMIGRERSLLCLTEDPRFETLPVYRIVGLL
ncbi:hypothetical protein Tco_0308387 [Tanacetum coccineum]